MPPSDPKREFAVRIVRHLKDAGYQALWAGGCVRDYLMGRDPEDYDVATDARPDDVRRLFGKRRTLAVGASFGVIIVLGPKKAGQIEVATFRTEGPYLDGRHPAQVQFSSPEEDARRRDFTINGMFYDPVEERVLDFVDGQRDLEQRILRAIGDPHERMREDKLRMLRAVRFAATLDFQLDAVTAQAVRDLASEIEVVSAERIAQEFKRMLVHPFRRRALDLPRQLGLLSHILPELSPVFGSPPDPPSPEWDRTLRMLERLETPGFELAMAVLLHTVPERVTTICRRLRLSNQEIHDVDWLVRHQHALDDAPQLRPARLKRLLVHPLIHDLLALMRVQRLAADGDLTPVEFCEDYLRRTPREEIDPPVLLTGHDLIEHGLNPGPRFKELLETVRDTQLNGEVHTKAEALALVDRLTADEDD